MIRLSEAQRFDWLRLSRTQGVGPRTFQGLINRFGGAASALEALPGLAAAKGRSIHIPEPREIEAELRKAERLGARFIAYGESGYPDRLREIPGPPPLLAVMGKAECLMQPAIGIVGSRNSSAAGRKMAQVIASGLAEAGFIIVSGLARGVDTEAHRASLHRGTIGVLAGGLDKPYPPENAELMGEMLEQGAIISEMPFGLAPRGRDFPRRNRLISGVSLGIVVVEAARRSGTLITARMANEQGREVFAIPGSPLDPRCEGTNDLLRDGANVVTSVEDILTILRPLAGEADRSPRLFRESLAQDSDAFFDELLEGVDDAPANPPQTGMNGFIHQPRMDEAAAAPDAALLELLSPTPMDVDTLGRMAGLTPAKLRIALTELDLDGQITWHSGNRVSRVV